MDDYDSTVVMVLVAVLVEVTMLPTLRRYGTEHLTKHVEYRVIR